MSAIAFIDSGVSCYEALARAIKSSTTVVVLNSQIDRVKQITQALQQGNYQEVHLISHGSPGCLDLGNTQLSIDTLEDYTPDLKTWFSNSVSSSSCTLLIYGCNVASGDAGAEFITKLQQQTGANIVASTSLTGNAIQGGNWELEVTTNSDINIELVIDEATQLAYQGVFADFTVTTTDDENDGSEAGTGLSLREAIALSNQSEGEDTITFNSSLSGGTIALTQTESNGRGGEFNQDLDITDSVNIIGLGANNLTIDGLSGGNGIFKITGENTNVNLEGLSIANGDYTRLFLNDPLPGGAIDFEGANLTVKDSVIVGSDSTFGGAINNSGNATIINSTVTDSSGVDDSFPGGAIYNTGTLDISNSTISNNRSRGIANGGTLEVNNSNISDNFGGGVFNRNSATVTSSIISNNSSSDVIFTTVTPGTNTDDDVTGIKAFISGGNNLIGVVDGFGSSAFDSPSVAGFVNGENGDIVGTAENPIDPKLGELQDNGGATPTQELLADSPAIDAGSNPNNLATDQRGEGFNRTVGNGTDIGAYEVQDGGVDNGGGNDGGTGNIPHELIVSTLEDENDGNFSVGDLSLREAIQLAENDNTISFDSNLSGGTITLSLGELEINKSLNIEGLGADNLTIDGNNASRVFNISDGNAETKLDVSLTGLTITGGSFTDTNTGKSEGGITNQENLTLSDSSVTGNSTGISNQDAIITINNSHIDNNNGSGLFNTDSKITINSSTVDNNTGINGGISSNNSELNIFNSSVSGNSGLYAGGIGSTATTSDDLSTTNIENSIISNNQAGALSNSGGISATSILNIKNSTISNNFGDPGNPFDPKGRASEAGGIYFSDGTANISNSTISDNIGVGYGIITSEGNSSTTITSSIVAGNVSNDGENTKDLRGEFTSGGNNLIGNGDVDDGISGFTDGVNGDIVGTTDNPIDPKLGQLEDNGGLTLTQELLAGSPAIDAGSNPNNLATDQRGEGFNRTVGNGTDIGAYEVQDTGGNNGGSNPHPNVATSGDDALTGTPCNDTIDGLEGNDILSGGDGNDTLYGGHGDDTLSGDNGHDVFALQSGQGTDVILDFTDGSDLFGLTNGLCFGSLSIVNNDCGNGAIIQDANNNNRVLALVENIDAASLTEEDFVSH
jgi:Domain of unknown function (DUF4347)/RTX calcium-binding nonapeptide repeat (4 copies)